MKKRGIFSRMYEGVKGYTYKISGMRLIRPCAYYITDTIADLAASLRKKEDPRSYDDVVKEFKLSEQDINKKKTSLMRQCVFYLAIAVCVFLYASWHVTKLKFMVVVNYYLISLVLFAFAFRMHFYRFLLLKKNLGLTYKDWFRAIFNGDI